MPGTRWSKRPPTAREAEPPAELLDAAARAADRQRPGRGCRDLRQRGAGRGLLAHPRQPVRGRARAFGPATPARHLACRSTTCRGSWPRPRPRSSERFPAPMRQRLRPSRRRQYPFPRPRRHGAASPTGSNAKAPAVTRLVHDLVTAAGGSISRRAWHRPDEARRARAPGPRARHGSAGDQARARPEGHHEPRQAASLREWRARQDSNLRPQA